MIYNTTIKVTFPFPAEMLYAALTDLSRYPLWNSGMISVKPQVNMHEGLLFKSTSIVLGQKNHSVVEVVKLDPDKTIEIKSQSGAIPFVARYDLASLGDQSCEVMCVLEFEITGITLKFALPVIQSMAKARLTGDLETLKALLAQG